MKQRFMNVILLSLLSFFVLLGYAHASNYNLTYFDYPGSNNTIASGANNSGLVVGYTHDGSWSNGRGFSYDGVGFTDIVDPGAVDSRAFGINNSGIIVGSTRINNSRSGYVYNGGTFQLFNVPGAFLTAGVDINDSDQITGYYVDGISSNTYGFLFDGTQYNTIDVPGATQTISAAINNDGAIVGNFEDNLSIRHGFIYANGLYQTIDYPGAVQTELMGINNSGLIVGNVQLNSSMGYQGFLYDGATFQLLNFSGIVGGISDDGSIVGTYGPDGVTSQGFLATPVPLPGTMLLLFSGMAALLFKKKTG